MLTPLFTLLVSLMHLVPLPAFALLPLRLSLVPLALPLLFALSALAYCSARPRGLPARAAPNDISLALPLPAHGGTLLCLHFLSGDLLKLLLVSDAFLHKRLIDIEQLDVKDEVCISRHIGRVPCLSVSVNGSDVHGHSRPFGDRDKQGVPPLDDPPAPDCEGEGVATSARRVKAAPCLGDTASVVHEHLQCGAAARERHWGGGAGQQVAHLVSRLGKCEAVSRRQLLDDARTGRHEPVDRSHRLRHRPARPEPPHPAQAKPDRAAEWARGPR
eukprot:scaffold310180_cov30-Tisochrysis_lutea.AAC.5